MSQEDDDLDTVLPELPELSEADEAYVRDLLASLPPVPVPDDLAARLEAALRAEADQGGTPPSGASSATATVVPAGQPSRRAGQPQHPVLQVAAAGLIVVAGGGRSGEAREPRQRLDSHVGRRRCCRSRGPSRRSSRTAGTRTATRRWWRDVRSLATKREPTELTPTADGNQLDVRVPLPAVHRRWGHRHH